MTKNEKSLYHRRAPDAECHVPRSAGPQARTPGVRISLMLRPNPTTIRVAQTSDERHVTVPRSRNVLPQGMVGPSLPAVDKVI